MNKVDIEVKLEQEELDELLRDLPLIIRELEEYVKIA